MAARAFGDSKSHKSFEPVKVWSKWNIRRVSILELVQWSAVERWLRKAVFGFDLASAFLYIELLCSYSQAKKSFSSIFFGENAVFFTPRNQRGSGTNDHTGSSNLHAERAAHSTF
jgi:hypothetical protein